MFRIVIIIFSITIGFAQAYGADTPPPKKLIHLGDKAVLLKNAKLGNVSQEDWDLYIMGTKSRYGLAPYRRGLYGGTNFDELEKYGTIYFGQKKVPWLMEISIKEECRQHKAYSSLHEDPRFAEWVMVNINELIGKAMECLHPEIVEVIGDCGQLLQGNVIANGEPESKCDKWMQRYLDEASSRVVKDNAEFDSWYIRDRSCIENIQASPKTVLNTLLLANWDLKSRTSGWSGTTGAYGGAIFSMLLGSLSEDHSVSAEIIADLRAKAEHSDISPTFLAESPEAKNLWIKREVSILLDAYERCRKKTDWKNFKSAAAEFELKAQFEEAAKTENFLALVAKTTEKLKLACD